MAKFNPEKKYLENTYTEGSLAHRAENFREYEETEKVVNAYIEGACSAHALCLKLGTIISSGIHESSRIYAFEQLIKMLAETPKENEQDIDMIVREAVFHAATSDHPIRKVYLLGMLEHFASPELARRCMELSEHNARMGVSGDEKLRVEAAISNTLSGSIQRSVLRDKQEKQDHQEKRTFFDFESRLYNQLQDDFSNPEDQGLREQIKLLAKYYDMDPRATSMPDLGRLLIQFHASKKSDGQGGGGIPECFVRLPQSHLPTEQKIEEADEYGLKFIQDLAYIDGAEKVFVSYDISPEQSHEWTRTMRVIRDEGDASGIENQYRDAIKEKILTELAKTEPEKAEKMREKDLQVVFRTVRDFSDKEKHQYESSSVYAEDNRRAA